MSRCNKHPDGTKENQVNGQTPFARSVGRVVRTTALGSYRVWVAFLSRRWMAGGCAKKGERGRFRRFVSAEDFAIISSFYWVLGLFITILDFRMQAHLIKRDSVPIFAGRLIPRQNIGGAYANVQTTEGNENKNVQDRLVAAKIGDGTGRRHRGGRGAALRRPWFPTQGKKER